MGTELLLYLGGLALLDTLSPTIIGVTLYLLLGNQPRTASRLFVYLSTVAILYVVLGIIMMLGFTSILDAFSSLTEHVIVSRTLFAIGVILFIASFFIPTNKKRTIPLPKTESLLSITIIGLTTFVIEAGTAFPYFAAIGLMTSEGIPCISGSHPDHLYLHHGSACGIDLHRISLDGKVAGGTFGETEAEACGAFEFGSELGDVHRGGGVDLEYNLKNRIKWSSIRFSLYRSEDEVSYQ
ncbi:GAP family protein [Rossellomorea sp. H39__3]